MSIAQSQAAFLIDECRSLAVAHGVNIPKHCAFYSAERTEKLEQLTVTELGMFYQYLRNVETAHNLHRGDDPNEHDPNP